MPNDKEILLENILLDEDFSKILPPSVRKPLPIFQSIKSTFLNSPLPINYDKKSQRDYLYLSAKGGNDSFSSPNLKYNDNYSFLRFYYCGSPDLKSGCLSIVTDNNNTIQITGFYQAMKLGKQPMFTFPMEQNTLASSQSHLKINNG